MGKLLFEAAAKPAAHLPPGGDMVNHPYTRAELQLQLSRVLSRFRLHARLVRHKTFHNRADERLTGGRATLRTEDGKTLKLVFERTPLGVEWVTEAEFETDDERSFHWRRSDNHGRTQDISDWFGRELYSLASRYELFEPAPSQLSRLGILPRRR